MIGYLYLQTHTEHPGMVRFRTSPTEPDPERPEQGASIRYIARFNDIDAALMHVQNQLHRRLMDVEARLYRSGLAEAMAVVEADNLTHQRRWIDPTLDEQDLRQMEQLAAAGRERERRWGRIWQGVGYLFLALLAARAFGLF